MAIIDDEGATWHTRAHGKPVHKSIRHVPFNEAWIREGNR
jgi:hypothetical protein